MIHTKETGDQVHWKPRKKKTSLDSGWFILKRNSKPWRLSGWFAHIPGGDDAVEQGDQVF
jgi:hypothetical protein